MDELRPGDIVSANIDGMPCAGYVWQQTPTQLLLSYVHPQNAYADSPYCTFERAGINQIECLRPADRRYPALEEILVKKERYPLHYLGLHDNVVGPLYPRRRGEEPYLSLPFFTNPGDLIEIVIPAKFDEVPPKLRRGVKNYRTEERRCGYSWGERHGDGCIILSLTHPQHARVDTNHCHAAPFQVMPVFFSREQQGRYPHEELILGDVNR
jgi:hypothetical protein